MMEFIDSEMKSPQPGNEMILMMQCIDKQFQGVHALKKCSLHVKKGEIHALVGENGAGKSTLMRCLTGIYDYDEGEIYFKGERAQFKTPKEAMTAGIAIVHQELNLIHHLTAAQNIFIGRESGGFFTNEKAINEKCKLIFKNLNLNIDPNEMVGNLSIGKQQMVEIAKAISYDADIIILDEPTTALTESETSELFKIMFGLKEKGVAMIFISHRMDEIIKISDRITIMRDGEYIDELTTDKTTIDEIIQKMVGRTIFQQPKTKSTVPKDAPVVLSVKNLSSSKVKDVSFDLKKGEILGFAGLMGAGRTEVARLLFGADMMSTGSIAVHGKKVFVRTPKDAVKAGIGYLSEDRKRYGLSVLLSVADNCVLASLDDFIKKSFVNTTAVRNITKDYIKKLGIKTTSEDTPVKFLSGGNQQKVVIAKWLIKNCDILIFDEPTRGIDVGAKSEIYKLMDELAKQGKSIIMISSELQEILRMSDRIAVMCEGKITKILGVSEGSQENIMKYATQNVR